jgi:hypothetical protein
MSQMVPYAYESLERKRGRGRAMSTTIVRRLRKQWLRCFCGTLGLVAGVSGLTAVAATSSSSAAAASSTWTASTVPIGILSPTAGSDPEVNFNSLACPAVGSCVAVGNYNDSYGNQQGLIETQSSSPPSNPCAAYTGNNAFLCSAYEDLLGRAPDSGGLTYWSAQLASGMSRSVVAYDITTSTEYRDDLISDYYEYYLGRPSDSGGLTYWVAQLNGGASDQSVLAAILGSGEFYADSGSTAGGFLNALYSMLLGRASDSGGLAYWESQLSSGTPRSAVAGAFLSSTEYRTDLVNDYYETFLGRASDSGGLTYWVAQLAGGASNESVIAAIVGSSEFYADATS